MLFGLSVAVGNPATASQSIPFREWVPQQHDRLIADTEANTGYITHENGTYTTFPIGSGQQKVVHYGGKTYNATTPADYWVVKSTTIQTNRIDFGKSGMFLRLYRNGTDRTSYGIHATSNINELLAADDRYKSFGCILVSNEVLEALLQTYTLNKGQLEVATTRGLNKTLVTEAQGL
jgi:hypothetical protein